MALNLIVQFLRAPRSLSILRAIGHLWTITPHVFYELHYIAVVSFFCVSLTAVPTIWSGLDFCVVRIGQPLISTLFYRSGLCVISSPSSFVAICSFRFSALRKSNCSSVGVGARASIFRLLYVHSRLWIAELRYNRLAASCV